MGDGSGIEWTDATWNPIVGCSLVSPGCTNCYAMKQAARIVRMQKGLTHYAGTVTSADAGAVWTGVTHEAPRKTLLEPLHWTRRRRIFVNSMSDLFHETIAATKIDLIFAVMALCPHHTFQVLTKRSDRMRRYMSEHNARRIWHLADQIACEVNLSELHPSAQYLRGGAAEAPWPLPNVWMGVSVEDRYRATRIDDLIMTPAWVRFVSFEPLLGDVGAVDLMGIDWAIIGGESGPRAREFDLEWAYRLIPQCRHAGTKVFVKQVGSRPIFEGMEFIIYRDRKGGDPTEWPEDLRIREMPGARAAE